MTGVNEHSSERNKAVMSGKCRLHFLIQLVSFLHTKAAVIIIMFLINTYVFTIFIPLFFGIDVATYCMVTSSKKIIWMQQWKMP
jgi:hypothetical protein